MALWSAHVCKALQSMESAPPGTLPTYDEESVHQTKQLIGAIMGEAENSDDNPQRRAILEAFAGRLEKGLDIYHRSRLNRIMEVRCQCRGTPGKDVKKAMAPHEVAFLNSYAQALAEYTKAIGYDPTAQFRPPQGLNAEVKALRDLGSIFAGGSFISLKQNEILTLRVSVAQELEQLGFVQITEYLK